MKKRILILCLAGVFVLSFAACGRQAADESLSAGNATVGQQEEAKEAQNDPEDPAEKPGQEEQQEENGQDSSVPEQAEEQESSDETGSQMASFWGSTTLATSVSDSYASVQDAYVDGNQLVINGTYDIETEDGQTVDTSDAGEHRFTISGNASLGSMGGEGEPETVSPEEFGELLQYDVQNNPGLGLVFYVENDVVVEAWITS